MALQETYVLIDNNPACGRDQFFIRETYTGQSLSELVEDITGERLDKSVTIWRVRFDGQPNEDVTAEAAKMARDYAIKIELNAGHEFRRWLEWNGAELPEDEEAESYMDYVREHSTLHKAAQGV